jgi:hypothetical protein
MPGRLRLTKAGFVFGGGNAWKRVIFATDTEPVCADAHGDAKVVLEGKDESGDIITGAKLVDVTAIAPAVILP